MINILNWINWDYLLFTEIIHLTVSLFIWFFIYKFYYRSYWVFVFALIWWFFIDADHLIDYFLCFWNNFDIQSFLSWESFKICQKSYELFHAWEYIIILLIIFISLNKKYKLTRYCILALAISILWHLITDVFTNEAYFRWYSIIYRIKNNFDLKTICNN